MTDREKLIDLLKQIDGVCPKDASCHNCEYEGLGEGCSLYAKADHLIANGVTVQEWIPVTERLPEENERVLACYINPLRKDRPPRMMVGEGTSTQIVKGKVYLWCGGWRSITHWMPLPEPPQL